MARKTKTTPDDTTPTAIEDVATAAPVTEFDPALAAGADENTPADDTLAADSDPADATGADADAAPDDATAATDGTEVDRANPRPSAEDEGDARYGEADASGQRPDAAASVPSTEDPAQGDADQSHALVPDGHIAIVFQRDHVIDDGLQGTPRETRFEKGARHVMSLASARHFTSRGIAVEI
ncbi:hypothetical protein T8T21_08485 [Limimaricola variabilis]|uniref:hypothetical protein n=1 Tax=Limimaricola variabilis TaxID=1492771 RepID=UPI002AC8FF50|nr:hypothetical protein [Limimaricola variabilis]WPY93164.1 hypothetical protein T8T21_08485 [Limimaricola variabilis]